MDADPVHIVAQGQLTMPDAAWEQARSRAAVIGSLAALGTTRLADADRAASGQHLNVLAQKRWATLEELRLTLREATPIDIFMWGTPQRACRCSRSMSC